MPGLSLGSLAYTTTGSIKIGTQNVQRIYVGGTLVFPTSILTPSTSSNYGAGFNNGLYSIVAGTGGSFYAAGTFTAYSGSARNRILKVNSNGTIDSTFNIGTGFDQTAGFSDRAIALQPDEKLIVGLAGGVATSYSGSSTAVVTRINANGTLDTTFRNNVSASLAAVVEVTNPVVQDIQVQPDGKILICAFTKLFRVNADGTRDTTFNVIGTGNEFTSMTAVRVLPSGDIIAGGTGTSTIPGIGLSKFNNSGSLLQQYGINYVQSICLSGSGFVAASNYSLIPGGSVPAKISFFNAAGTKIREMVADGGTSGLIGRSVRSVFYDQGRTYAVGYFSRIDLTGSSGIVAIDDTFKVDRTFAVGGGLSYNNFSEQFIGWTITSGSDGNILTGGTFMAYSGSVNFPTSSFFQKITRDGRIA